MNDDVYDLHRGYDPCQDDWGANEGFTGIESTTHYGQKN